MSKETQSPSPQGQTTNTEKELVQIVTNETDLELGFSATKQEEITAQNIPSYLRTLQGGGGCQEFIFSVLVGLFFLLVATLFIYDIALAVAAIAHKHIWSPRWAIIVTNIILGMCGLLLFDASDS